MGENDTITNKQVDVLLRRRWLNLKSDLEVLLQQNQHLGRIVYDEELVAVQVLIGNARARLREKPRA